MWIPQSFRKRGRGLAPVASAGPEPAFGERKFICPQCGAFAQQDWHDLRLGRFQLSKGEYDDTVDQHRVEWKVSLCLNCERPSLWFEEELVTPVTKWEGPDPVADMPDAIVELYEEARSVASISPRATAALLRRLLERLLVDLGAPGDNLDQDLQWGEKNLELPAKVFKAAKALKLMGDHSLHAGDVDLFDNAESARHRARAMMDLVNQIVAHTSVLDAAVARVTKEASDAKAANKRQRRN